MKVIQILTERINSANELRSSFDQQQWSNILCHFISKFIDRNTGSPVSSALRYFIGGALNAGELENAQRLIGLNMASGLSPEAWNAYAIRYNMGVPNSSTGLSWDDIYNHLAPHAATPCELEVMAANTSPGVSNDTLLDTEETREEFISLINTSTADVPDPITTETELASFLRQSLQAIQNTPQRRAADDQGHNFRWFVDNAANEGNPLKNNWVKIFNNNKEIIDNGQTISKESLIELVWRWVIAADYVISAARRTSAG